MSHRACVNLQPVAKVLDTLYTVPYFGLTGLLIILCMWSPLFLLSKLLALQDNAQNLEEQQLWVKGRREVSIILHRSVTSRFEVKKAGFSLECLNIFATGCSSKWCIRIQNLVFVCPHVNIWPAFSKLFTLNSVFEKMHFGDHFHQIHLNGRPNQRKNLHFQTKMDTCGWGLSLQAVTPN